MELFGAGVENVGGLRRLRTGFALQPALAGGVVDGDAGLHVVAEDVERQLAVALHAAGLQAHAAADLLVAHEDGRGPVEHVVGRPAHVVGHRGLVGHHGPRVHGPGAGDEVALVGVLAGEAPGDEVAAIVQTLSIHAVILHRLPARGLDPADVLPLLRWHQLQTDVCISLTAAAQAVQLTVFFKNILRDLIKYKKREILIMCFFGKLTQNNIEKYMKKVSKNHLCQKDNNQTRSKMEKKREKNSNEE